MNNDHQRETDVLAELVQAPSMSADHIGMGGAGAAGVDQVSDLDQRRRCPIAVTGSNCATRRADRIEARIAPGVVSRIARP